MVVSLFLSLWLWWIIKYNCTYGLNELDSPWATLAHPHKMRWPGWVWEPEPTQWLVSPQFNQAENMRYFRGVADIQLPLKRKCALFSYPYWDHVTEKKEKEKEKRSHIETYSHSVMTERIRFDMFGQKYDIPICQFLTWQKFRTSLTKFLTNFEKLPRGR